MADCYTQPPARCSPRWQDTVCDLSRKPDAGLWGLSEFCDDDQQRLDSTIDAIRADLAATEPLIYRYSGMRGKEGAFVSCTFWLAEALARTGRTGEAGSVFDSILGCCNDVGLLAEEIDPGTGAFLGDFPQRLSHLALIGAAYALTSPPGRGPKPPNAMTTQRR